MGNKKIPSEKKYAGDQKFQEYSESFIEFWQTFAEKEQLLGLVGHNLVLARPLAFHFEENYAQWLNAPVPALDNSTLDC